MTRKNKILIILTMYCLIICSCGISEKNEISFSDIQTKYYLELKKEKQTDFNPFYIEKKFFDNVEKKMNEMIKDSDNCSILIQSSVNHGKYIVSLLYESQNEIYFHSWSNFGEEKYCMVNQKYAKNVLKLRPKKNMKVTTSNLHVLDGTSQYIIKIINKRKYYYCNHYGKFDRDYKELIELFRKYS